MRKSTVIILCVDVIDMVFYLTKSEPKMWAYNRMPEWENYAGVAFCNNIKFKKYYLSFIWISNLVS